MKDVISKLNQIINILENSNISDNVKIATEKKIQSTAATVVAIIAATNVAAVVCV